MIRRFRARPIPPKILWSILGLLFVLVILWFWHRARQTDPQVTDFDSCVATGSPVLETYPEQCSYQGKLFFKPGQEPPRPY